MVIQSSSNQPHGSNSGVPDLSLHQPRVYIAQAEFITSAQAKCVFGIVKSHLYALKDEGKIKSVCIRKRGAARGKRLWSCDSIRAYLLANLEEASSTVEAK
jgi:hypothetical protein